MDINTTHNEFSSFQYQYIMHLTTFINYSLSLSLPAWFQVLEIEVRFMTIRTPSLHQNYWPWRNTFHNFDRASITILVASNNFLVIKARYILFTLWPMNLCSTLILKNLYPGVISFTLTWQRLRIPSIF